MEVKDYGTMGQTVVVSPGDKLHRVPRSHQRLLTDDVRAVFQDAPRYFARVADLSPFPRMAEWLKAALRHDQWSLVLHDGAGWWNVGFRLSPKSATSAVIGLPTRRPTSQFPERLRLLFDLVGFVDWSGPFEGRGGIYWPRTLDFWPPDGDGGAANSPRIDWEATLEWGGFNGSVLFATPDDRAGWLGLSRDVKLLGTVADAINWWFATLLVGTTPTMDRGLN